jgi:hypothetical protein
MNEMRRCYRRSKSDEALAIDMEVDSRIKAERDVLGGGKILH